MKKKNLFSLMMGAALIAGLASCSKDAGNGGGDDPAGTGSAKITLAFEKSPSTYGAGESSAKPTTSWQKNIKSLAIFVVNSSNTIVSAQAIPFIANDNMAEQTHIVKGIPAGNGYDIYVFANWDQGDNVNGKNWSVATAKGRNIADLYIDALVSESYVDYKHKGPNGGEDNSVGYEEAPEVFVAKHSKITIPGDDTYVDTNPYDLTRIVSLVRVRIDQSKDNLQNHNDEINFQHPNASLRIRRARTGINLLYTDPTMTTTTRRAQADAKDNVFFAQGEFGSAKPTSGYSSGTILTGDYKSWKDVILIPAGHASSSNEKLDVVVTGIVNK